MYLGSVSCRYHVELGPRQQLPGSAGFPFEAELRLQVFSAYSATFSCHNVMWALR